MNRQLTCTICVSLVLVSLSTGCQQFRQRFAGNSPAARTANEVETLQLTSARLRERNGQYQQALEIYRQLESAGVQPKLVSHRIAVTHMKTGNTEGALVAFKKALELDPGNPELLTDYGYALHLQGEYAQSETLFRRALKQSPGMKRARVNLGLSQGMQGELDQAYYTFRDVVGEAEAHANIAYLHVQRGEGDLAIERYSRALSLDPKLKPAGQALVQIAELQRRAPQQRGPLTEPGTQIAKAPAKPEPSPATTTQPIVPVANQAQTTRQEIVPSYLEQNNDLERRQPTRQPVVKTEVENPFASLPSQPQQQAVVSTPATKTHSVTDQPSPKARPFPVTENENPFAALEANSQPAERAEPQVAHIKLPAPESKTRQQSPQFQQPIPVTPVSTVTRQPRQRASARNTTRVQTQSLPEFNVEEEFSQPAASKQPSVRQSTTSPASDHIFTGEAVPGDDQPSLRPLEAAEFNFDLETEFSTP